jgi:outer membrane protein OmpA-like peptidoglycan-associated protein
LALVIASAGATPATAQSIAGGKPDVVVDNSVLEQLGPAPDLPGMLLRRTGLETQKIVLVPPKSLARNGKSHETPQKPASVSEAGGIVHLHPIKCHCSHRSAKHPSTAVKESSDAPTDLTKPVSSAITSETLQAPIKKSKSKSVVTPPTGPISPVAASNNNNNNNVSPITPASNTPPATAPVTPPASNPSPPSSVVAAAPAAATPPTAPPPVTGNASAPQQLALTAQPLVPEPAPAQTQDALSSLSFEKESARLPDGARDILAHLASRMTDDATLEVQLLAYAAGSEENASKARRLSLSRALAVRTFLIDQGVRSTRIEVRALGNKVPDGSADRVDIVVQKRG